MYFSNEVIIFIKNIYNLSLISFVATGNFADLGATHLGVSSWSEFHMERKKSIPIAIVFFSLISGQRIRKNCSKTKYFNVYRTVWLLTSFIIPTYGWISWRVFPQVILIVTHIKYQSYENNGSSIFERLHFPWYFCC